MHIKQYWIGLLFLGGVAQTGYSQKVHPLIETDTAVRPAAPKTMAEGAVGRLYRLLPSGLLWCDAGEKAADLRHALLYALDSAVFDGMKRSTYQADELQWADSMVRTGQGSDQWRDWDRWYTDAALAFAFDLYQGAGVGARLSYDGVSARYEARDEQYLAEGLARVGSGADLRRWQ